MIEFYPEIRLVHVAGVLTSGALFLLRGATMIGGWRLGQTAALRYFGYAVDTVWLTAALMLMNIVEQFPLRHGWLTAKVALLLVYLPLAFVASRQDAPRMMRLGSWLAGLAVYAFIYTVARAHHPLGLLRGLTG